MSEFVDLKVKKPEMDKPIVQSIQEGLWDVQSIPVGLREYDFVAVTQVEPSQIIRMQTSRIFPDGLREYDFGAVTVVELSRYIRTQMPRFFATERCDPDHEVKFVNRERGGFTRIFCNTAATPEDACNINFMPVFELTTEKIRVVPVWVSAGTCGDIFIGVLMKSSPH